METTYKDGVCQLVVDLGDELSFLLGNPQMPIFVGQFFQKGKCLAESRTKSRTRVETESSLLAVHILPEPSFYSGPESHSTLLPLLAYWNPEILWLNFALNKSLVRKGMESKDLHIADKH